MDNFLTNLGNFAQEGAGLIQLNTGADIEIAGAKINAQAYRSAGISSEATAGYNIAINNLEYNRQRDVLSRTIHTAFSQNRAIQGASGFSFASKSYLAVQNQIRSTYERQIQQAQTSHEQQNALIQYEGQAAKVEFENRARAAEYEASIASYNANSATISGITDMVQQGISSFMLG